MGVTSVLLWKDNNGGHIGMIKFHDRITTTLLGSFKDKWGIQVKLYRDTKNTETSNSDKFMYTTEFYNTSKIYCLIDDVIVEAEREMESILEKLKNLWYLTKTIIYEGSTYIIGDFLIRVAVPKLTSYKGMLVEVEYTSTVNPHVAAPILHEFIEMLKLPEIEIVPSAEYSFSKIGLSEDTFTRAHTDYQYMMLFKSENLL
ncbi:mediator complex, subunit Med20 [Glomus cerebriforme]|uniref:Mediator of RNA polymerase II transcription subunit 20 n=1 Tax=Glomus cerebriforme TaxID=658196 RepID=A0A397SVD4_9GLOM|nr:mediator complex, subunit Med20 [Glomus cerebriforme]